MIQPCSQPPAMVQRIPSMVLHSTTRPLRLIASLRARCTPDTKLLEAALSCSEVTSWAFEGAAIVASSTEMDIATTSSISVKPRTASPHVREIGTEETGAGGLLMAMKQH